MGQPKPGSQAPHVGAVLEKCRQRHPLASRHPRQGCLEGVAVVGNKEGRRDCLLGCLWSREKCRSSGGSGVD